MNVVYNLTDYEGSKDYEQLWKKSKKTSIICIVDYDRLDHINTIRDVAHTIKDERTCQVSARGIAYIYAFSKADFIKQCEESNLVWIPPTKES